MDAPKMTRLRRLTREGHRQLVEDMATVLIGEPELGDDTWCTITLLAHGFHPGDIFDCLDTAREIARQALVDEADLWERLMR
jgi:hypothetical protein